MNKPITIKDLIATFKKLNNDFTNFLNNDQGITELINGGLEPNYDNPQIIKYYKTKNSIESKIEDCLKKIYKLSITENYYFFDCPFEVFKNTLQARKDDYLKSNARLIDIDQINFYEEEIQKLNTPSLYRKLQYESNNKINYSHFVGNNFSKFQISINKKIRYLKLLINEAVLNEQTLNSINKTVPSKEHIQKSENFHSIFKDKKAEQWFCNTLEELNVIDENKKSKRGFQVAANTIFENVTCKREIFKFNLSKVEFIAFLNSELQAEIKDKYKLSQGNTYDSEVQKLIKTYLV